MSNKVHTANSYDTDRRSLDFDAVADGCFLSRWLQIHSIKLLFASLFRPLTKSNLHNLSEEMYPQTNFEKCNEPAASSDDPQQQPSLLRVIFTRVLLLQFIWAGFLAIAAAGMAFSGPLVIKQILNYVKQRNPTSQQTTEAYVYTGVWIAIYCLRIFVSEYTERLIFNQAVKTEQILTVSLFSKMTRLSPAYRLHTDKGELLNYLNVDIKLVFSFVKSCAILFGSPVTLIVVQAFLVKEVGHYGWVLTGVLAIAGGVQVFLNKKMSSVRNRKLAVLSDRVNTNIELISSIREVKMLGWEQLIIDKNSGYRSRENKFNRTFFYLSNLFELIINITPAATVLLVFLLKLLIQHNPDLDTSQVYTVLAFVGMTYGPTKSLLITIVGAMDGVAAFRRIQHFLQAQEILQKSNCTESVPPGQIVIKQASLSWETDKSDQHFKKKSTGHLETESELDDRRVQTRSESQIQIRKGLETSLNNVSLESMYPRSPERFLLAIPTTLLIAPGSRIVLLSESDGGKTSFFNAIMGNLFAISGSVQYGGKIGYLPQKPWFRKASVRDNIVFGLPYDQKKLGKVYRTALLKDELPLLSEGELTEMKQLSHITESQKRRIALARALYSQPDILLLDEVFSSMDLETVKHLYENLRSQCSNKTIILSTHATSFLQSDDMIILFKKGTFKEMGRYRQLLAKKESYIHQLRQIDEKSQHQEEQHEQAAQKQLIEEQKLVRKRKLQERRKKLQKFVRELMMAAKTMPKEKLDELVHPPEEVLQKETSQKKSEAVSRLKGVPIKSFGQFLASSPVWFTVLLFLLSVLVQGTKIFADWWIGSLKVLPWKLSSTAAMEVYIGLICGFGLLFAVTGFLVPVASNLMSESISSRLVRSMALTNFKWFEQSSSLKIAGKLNRDFEEIFHLNNLVQTLWRMLIIFLSTIGLVGYRSPFFFLLAIFVIAVNVLILVLFLQVQREIGSAGAPYNEALLNTFEQMITGVDLWRSYDQLSQQRSQIFVRVYNATVCKLNYRFIYHGMAVLSQLSSLLIIAATAFFAVASNNSTISKEELALIGTTITLSLKLTGIMTGIVKGFVGLELSLKGAVKGAFDIIDQNQEASYNEPVPPSDWPANNAVEFKTVTLVQEGLSEPTVKDLTLSIDSGERFVLCSKDGSNKACLQAVCRLISPEDNEKPGSGIFVGGVNIASIGRKFIASKIMLLNELPFLFSSTVRENLDPFTEYSDEQIQQALKKVDMWNQIHPNPQKEPQLLKLSESDGKLLHVLESCGAQYSLGLQQKLAVARALLKRPQVLMMDSAISSLDERVGEQIDSLLRRELAKTTMMIITQQMDTTVESDKSVYLLKGHIKELGQPLKLLDNTKGRFANMVRKINPSLYEKMVVHAKAQKAVTANQVINVKEKPKPAALSFNDDMEQFKCHLQQTL